MLELLEDMALRFANCQYTFLLGINFLMWWMGDDWVLGVMYRRAARIT